MKNLFLSVFLVLFAAACGKSMSLQVAGSATTENSTLDVIDVTKVALSPTCLDITGKYLVKEIVEEGESEEDAETQVVEIAQTGCEKILIDMKDPLIQEEILLDGKLQVAKGSRVSMSAEATADAVKVTVVNSKDAPEEPVEIATLKVDLKLDAETGDLLVESEEFDSADKMIKARSLRMTKVKE